MFRGAARLHVVFLCLLWAGVSRAEGRNEAKGAWRGGPAREFSKHEVVVPSLSHARTKRHLDSTIHEDGHVHDITLGFTLDDQDILVDLQLNRDLLPKDYFEKYYQNGSHHIHRPNGEMAGLCHYQGVVRGREGSWAALSTCHGLSGAVFDGTELHYIERVPESPPAVHSPHYVFKHSHIIPQNLSCGYSGKPHPVRDLFHDETFTRLLRYKRSSSSSSSSSNHDDNGIHGHSSSNSNIRGPFNANPLSRYVELVLVTDRAEYEKYGHEEAKLFHRCKDIANIVNALYQPLNIFIALVGVEVWKDEDQVEISKDGDKTLTNFLNYRKVRLIRDHPNDNAQLLTGKQFDAGVVGKALKGPICTYQYSGGVNMDHSDTVGLVATTVAHEMGHNFGMEHDNEEECECPDKRCIMAPSSGSNSPTHWSSCSYEYLALSFERSMDYCLRNKPTSLFDSPVCGNGFVEPGEQCDCGLPDYCTNTCCNATTCMLYPNATCATGHCCDLQTCRPRMAGVECRSSVHECDLPEYCTGDSEYCPSDVFKADGHQCQHGQAFCHGGMCRTHGEQCKLLWGPTGQSSDDQCYRMNTQGSHKGNCGYNWVNDTYYRCSSDDIKCGLLHCMHLNERLEFGMESVSKVSHSFLKGKEGVIPCRVALVDMGLDMVDPGLAPDGAKCGKGKMCINQRCMPVANLKLAACDCHGNGVCNNNGHCHCDVGYAPPDCLYPGLGGSQDSGPASNPHGMFVFFLGIVPAVMMLLGLTYYARGNLQLWWKTKGRPATSKLSHVETNNKTAAPSAPAMEVGVVGWSVDLAVPQTMPSPRSPTPPSSQGSKSNSPLLNGHAAAISNRLLVDKPSSPSGTIPGKYGFTISPRTETSNGVGGEPVPAIPPPPQGNISSPAHAPTSNTANGQACGWKVKPLPGAKMSISGPSLQGSTNPAIASHVPSRIAPPPPLAAQQTNTFAGSPSGHPAPLPPVAVVTPSRRPPHLAVRPLSVPDAASLITQAGKQGNQPEVSSEVKRPEGDKPSTVARIASFLTKKDKPGSEASEADVEAGHCNTLPRKAAKIKRESLVQLEISAPMELQATELPANLVPVRSAPSPPAGSLKPGQDRVSPEENTKPAKVSWAPSVPQDKIPAPGDSRPKVKATLSTPAKGQGEGKPELQRMASVREPPVTIRPAIPKFGSMRAPRPKSLPPTRPSEPPPRPPLPMIPGTPESECYYDDCLNVQEGVAPLVSADEDGSPTENIYATIDDQTPEDSDSPLQEVTYAAPEETRKEKKSIFSFLYNKPKKKLSKDKGSPEDDVSSEPVYTNLVELPPESEAKIEDGETSSASSASASVSPPSGIGGHRTSTGSSEDGGLLSEIVTELSCRDADFVSALAKKRKKSAVKSASEEAKGSSSTKAKPSLPSITSEGNLSAIKTSSGSGNMSKSTSEPWGAGMMGKAATGKVSLTSPSSPPAAATSGKKPASNSEPRGILNYVNAAKSKISGPASSSPAPAPGSAVRSSSSSHKLKENNTITPTTPATTTTPTITTTATTATTRSSVPITTSSNTTTPMTLAASLAAVRAAGAAAGEAAAVASLAGNKKESQAAAPKSSFLHNRPTTQPPVSVSSPTSTTSSSPPSSLTTTTAASPTNVQTVPCSSTAPAFWPGRPVFPPDKIVFPPDKVVSEIQPNDKKTPTEKAASKGQRDAGGGKGIITSPTRGTGSSTSRGRGTSPPAKVTSPLPKPGSAGAASRGLTPSRSTTSSRSSSAGGSGMAERSRSATPQSGGRRQTPPGGNKGEAKPVPKATDKSGNKVTEKAPVKAGAKTADKSTDKPAPKRLGSKSAPAGARPGTSVEQGKGGSRPVRTSNSLVASMQQKFEKKESEAQDTKPLGKAGSASARKSVEVKPAVAPKPK
ncbi:hypothetical protein O3P69_006145 [Scylla paramamosain]|uniref:Disintegrin and metalloproteinase domain-containing protein 19 n=1 Tax=Scylla paramamosain TaxID=85552 RepID=A0AAW0U7J8_SCYPA